MKSHISDIVGEPDLHACAVIFSTHNTSKPISLNMQYLKIPGINSTLVVHNRADMIEIVISSTDDDKESFIKTN